MKITRNCEKQPKIVKNPWNMMKVTESRWKFPRFVKNHQQICRKSNKNNKNNKNSWKYKKTSWKPPGICWKSPKIVRNSRKSLKNVEILYPTRFFFQTLLRNTILITSFSSVLFIQIHSAIGHGINSCAGHRLWPIQKCCNHAPASMDWMWRVSIKYRFFSYTNGKNGLISIFDTTRERMSEIHSLFRLITSNR